MSHGKFLFILKFKMKICESRAAPPNSYPVAASSRAGYAIDPAGTGSMSNNANIPPSSSDVIPAVRHSMEIEPKLSYQDPPTPAMFPNSNSTPNLFVSNPIYDKPLHDGKSKRGKQNHDVAKVVRAVRCHVASPQLGYALGPRSYDRPLSQNGRSNKTNHPH